MVLCAVQVHFERTFCLSCFWKKHNMRAPTAYMAHFAAVPCCGEYSLEKVLVCCVNHRRRHTAL